MLDNLHFYFMVRSKGQIQMKELTTSNAGSVVHCKKAPFDVYIGRGQGSIWGNPFTHITSKNTSAQFIVGSREEAIAKYRQYILMQPALLAQLPALKGKILGCWCKPQACHGDVLLQLIDEYCK